MPVSQMIAFSLVGLLGLLTAFFGYRFIKVALGVYGFLSASAAGAYLSSQHLSEHLTVVVACGIAGGVIGLVVSVLSFDVALFLLGAFGGGIGGYFLCISGRQQFHPILIPLLAIAGGVAAILLRRIIIVLATSVLGAVLAASSALLLWKRGFSLTEVQSRDALEEWIRGVPEDHQAILIFAACLACAAITLQFTVTGRGPAFAAKRRDRTEENTPVIE